MKKRGREQPSKTNSTEVIIELDQPIVKPKPWNLFVLVLGIVLSLHPIAWILLLHYQPPEDDNKGIFFEYFSHFILVSTADITSRLFTIAMAIYCLFVGYMRMTRN